VFLEEKNGTPGKSRIMIRSNGQPVALTWRYDTTELWVDGVVHAIGLVLALVAATLLGIACVGQAPDWTTASALIYAASLTATLGVSAAYNMWPVSPKKWLLRRFDHSAIYLLIAATYTPFITQLKNDGLSAGVLCALWFVAIIGMMVKLLLPGRLDRLSILLYLLLGWSGLVLFEPLISTLPQSIFWHIAVGGLLYSIGVIFHIWERLRFQNAIWHGFVLAGAACHYKAVLDCVSLTHV
jgi:hemolysin III